MIIPCILSFIGGAIFGVVVMATLRIAGEEDDRE